MAALRCQKGPRWTSAKGTKAVASPSDIARAVSLLRTGGLVALPTETVYGLGADAGNELAVRRVFAVKGRPSTHPLIVHVASVAAARHFCRELTPMGETLARAFWPGPLTLVVRRSGLVSDVVTGGQQTVALRVPKHPVALALLEAFGGCIAAPSANRFGRVSPTTAEHVRADLGDDVDFVLDGGPCEVGVESTIIDVTTPTPRLLRSGGLAKEAIEAALGCAVERAEETTEVRAPGMLQSHYAPRAGVRLVTADGLAAASQKALDEGLRVVVMASTLVGPVMATARLEVPFDDVGFARVLYARLREADQLGDLILVVPPPESGMGLAVADRLKRAAAPRA
jgi:L-threonylcarbamoyladenylate synthase